MSYDKDPKDPSPEVVADSASDDEDPETSFAAEQRRGRERMIDLWRTAVRTVTEAAQREVAHNDAPDDAEAEASAAPDPTWVFPPIARRGPNN